MSVVSRQAARRARKEKAQAGKVHRIRVADIGDITLTVGVVWDHAPRLEFGVEFDLKVQGARLRGNRDLQFRMDPTGALHRVAGYGHLNVYKQVARYITPQQLSMLDKLLVYHVAGWIDRHSMDLPMTELWARLEESEDLSRVRSQTPSA